MSNLLPRDREIICNAVCGHFGIPAAKVFSRTKQADVVEVRHTIFYLIFKVTGANKSNIAKSFKMRPSAITHGLGRIADAMSVDEKFRNTVNYIEDRCRLLLKGEQ